MALFFFKVKGHLPYQLRYICQKIGWGMSNGSEHVMTYEIEKGSSESCPPSRAFPQSKVSPVDLPHTLIYPQIEITVYE